jgi:hypothetical protein
MTISVRWFVPELTINSFPVRHIDEFSNCPWHLSVAQLTLSRMQVACVLLRCTTPVAVISYWTFLFLLFCHFLLLLLVIFLVVLLRLLLFFSFSYYPFSPDSHPLYTSTYPNFSSAFTCSSSTFKSTYSLNSSAAFTYNFLLLLSLPILSFSYFYLPSSTFTSNRLLLFKSYLLPSFFSYICF